MDLVLAGAVMIVAGVLLVILATLRAGESRGDEKEEKRAEVKGGAVVMIGPIPIIIGSDARWTAIAIGLAIVLVILSLMLFTFG